MATQTPIEGPRKLRPAPPRGERGPAPLSPDLVRSVQRLYRLTEEYAGWHDRLADRLGIDRNTLFDLALAHFARAVRNPEPPPPFDPKLVPRGPWLPGLDPDHKGGGNAQTS